MSSMSCDVPAPSTWRPRRFPRRVRAQRSRARQHQPGSACSRCRCAPTAGYLSSIYGQHTCNPESRGTVRVAAPDVTIRRASRQLGRPSRCASPGESVRAPGAGAVFPGRAPAGGAVPDRTTNWCAKAGASPTPSFTRWHGAHGRRTTPEAVVDSHLRVCGVPARGGRERDARPWPAGNTNSPTLMRSNSAGSLPPLSRGAFCYDVFDTLARHFELAVFRGTVMDETRCWLAPACVCLPAPPWPPTAPPIPAAWKLIFNGKNLNGWTVHYASKNSSVRRRRRAFSTVKNSEIHLCPQKAGTEQPNVDRHRR